MAISLASVKKARAASEPIMIIYGVAGVGKTSLAAEAPAPIFLQLGDEGLPAGVEADTFGEVKTYQDVLDAIGALAGEDHEFQTLIVDALDSLETIVWAEACKRNGWNTIEDAGFGKGYVAAVNVWQDLVDGFSFLRREKKMNIILLGHCEISRFDSPTSDPYSRYRINLHKRAADLIEAAADIIGFVNYRVTLKKADVGFNKTTTHGEGGGQRIIYVEERPGFIAKNRFNMPAELPFKKGEGWSAIAKYLPEAA